MNKKIPMALCSKCGNIGIGEEFIGNLCSCGGFIVRCTKENSDDFRNELITNVTIPVDEFIVSSDKLNIPIGSSCPSVRLHIKNCIKNNKRLQVEIIERKIIEEYIESIESFDKRINNFLDTIEGIKSIDFTQKDKCIIIYEESL